MDEMAEQDEGGGGVEKGVVPGFLRDKGADFVAEAKLVADAAERVIWQVRPSGATKGATRRSCVGLKGNCIC